MRRHGHLRSTLLLTCVVLCNALHTLQGDNDHVVAVRVDRSSFEDVKGRHYDCPPRVRATVGLTSGEVRLNLELNINSYSHTVPVVIGTGPDTSERWRGRPPSVSTPCFYLDLSTTAAVSMTTKGDFPKMHGVFHTREYSYRISPAPNTLLRRKRSLRRRRYQEVHIVTSLRNPDAYLRSSKPGSRSKRQASKSHYNVALLVLADLALYKRWYGLTPASAADRRAEAIQSITYYYTHLVNEIDLRYRSIESPNFDISVKLAELYIATTADAAPWVETIKLTDTTPAQVDTDMAIDKLGDWLARNTGYQTYDHVTLFTGYNLFGRLPNGQKDPTKIGSAFLGGICGQSRVSVVEDRGHFRSALTTAHELGHSLNARHDGTNNNCPSADQYIMASTVETRSDDNIFRFSSCSITAFNNHLSQLKRAGRNCLLDSPSVHNQTASAELLKILPGQKYTVLQQCRLVYGDDSYSCGGQSDVTSLCAALVCYNPEDGHCYVLGSTPAFRGTTCGNKKWCDKSKCVESSEAPEASANCTVGDFGGEVKVGTRRMNCSAILAEYPWLCYQEELRDLCCASCGSLHQPEQTGCEYGDRALWCAQLSRSNCPRNDKACCRKCGQYQTGIPRCPYGDLYPWCRALRRDQCYDIGAKTCCISCHQWLTNIADCQYGNSRQDCSTRVSQARDCYTTSTEEQCCQTCNTLNTRVTSCPYGDRIGNCQTTRCVEEYYANTCCHTCHNFKITPTLPTPTLPTTTLQKATLPTTTPPTTTLPTNTPSLPTSKATTSTEKPTSTKAPEQPTTTRRTTARRPKPTTTATTITTTTTTKDTAISSRKPIFEIPSNDNINVGPSVIPSSTSTKRTRTISAASPQHASPTLVFSVIFITNALLFVIPRTDL